jgi:hypothetical protein
MKDRQIDTTIDGFRHVGINLTKEQYDDLCTLNMLILGSEHRKKIPIFNTMIVLKILGLLPAEMLCEPGSGHPVKNDEFSEELCQQKFGRFRFKD